MVIALCALCAACGQPAPAAPLAPGQLQGAIERAADGEGVPRSILLALSWLDSRWSMNEGKPSTDGAYGLFHLVDRADAPESQSLSRAAQLTGLPLEALRTDAFANARGGAALLRAEADRVFAGYKDLREDRLGDWYLVVMRASGVSNARLADDFAAQAYRLLRDGVVAQKGDETVRLVPQQFDLAGRAIWGKLEQDQSGQYCPNGACVAFVPAASGNYSTVRDQPITAIVIHDMEGTYSSTIGWFQNPASGVSAHYDIRSSDGQITQQVPDEDTAWHCGNHAVNNGSIGIEHEGFAHEGATWYTEAMYQSSAALARWLADQYKIPKDRTHILGHYEVPDPSHAGWFGGKSNHHDPCDAWAGAATWHNNTACYWDWTHYMNLITGGGGTPPPTGTLTGFVGDSCCGIKPATRKPLAGATVKLAGTTTTTTTDQTGTYLFKLPAGSYTPDAVITGYNPADHTSIGPGYLAALTVTAGQTTYGSILLTKATTTVALAPTLHFTSPAEGATLGITPVAVTGTLDDATVTSVTIAGQSFPSSSGHFSGTAALVAGSNSITATATNAAGTGSATVRVTYAPPATGVQGKITDASGPAVSVRVSLAPGSATATTAADGTYLLSAAPGTYTLTADSSAYLPVSQSVTVPAGALVTVDLALTAAPPATSPKLTVDSPQDGTTSVSETVTVSGRLSLAEPGSLSIDDESAPFDSSGRFSAVAVLQPGANDLVIAARGQGGVQLTQHVGVFYQPPAPLVTPRGCSSAGGISLLALLPFLTLRRRRR